MRGHGMVADAVAGPGLAGSHLPAAAAAHRRRRARQLGHLGPRAPRSRAGVAQFPHGAACAGPRGRQPHRVAGRRGAAGAAARRPARHTHPRQHHPSAGRGLARRPRAASRSDRPPPSAPRGAPDRGRDRPVPGRTG